MFTELGLMGWESFVIENNTFSLIRLMRYGCQQILLNPDNDLKAILEFLCGEAQRQNINLGSKTNQKFVQIPTARLKDRINQLCQQYGLRFEETEESYTSIASFLDSDLLPTFGEKPLWWQESGKRVKRGLYACANGTKINANGQWCGEHFKKSSGEAWARPE